MPRKYGTIIGVDPENSIHKTAFNKRVGYIIGIDPDIDNNGIACIQKNHRILEVAYLNFPETLEWVKAKYKMWRERYFDTAPYSFMVYVEAGWMNRGNWHITESRNGKYSPSAWAAAVGASAGACNAVSKKLIECFEYYGIPCQPMKPLRKFWKGKDGKITHDELLRELSLYRISHSIKGRSNQEVRDSVLLSLANL